MRWIITRDAHAEGTCSTVGIGDTNREFKNAMLAAPREARPHMATGFAEHMNFEFRLKDDDGGIDCEGRCLDVDQMDQDQAFAPLDWAESMYGSTSMEIRKVGTTKWEVL